MSIIEVRQTPFSRDPYEFNAYFDYSNKVGRAATRHFRNPARLYLVQIDSYIPKLEIGTVLLLAVVLDGINNGLNIIDGDFQPDYRHPGKRSDLIAWYKNRSVLVSEDGHDMSGQLSAIARACQSILIDKKIVYRINDS